MKLYLCLLLLIIVVSMIEAFKQPPRKRPPNKSPSQPSKPTKKPPVHQNPKKQPVPKPHPSNKKPPPKKTPAQQPHKQNPGKKPPVHQTTKHPVSKLPTPRPTSKLPVHPSTNKPPVHHSTSTQLPPAHDNDSARVSSKFTRRSLLKFLATKPKLWKSKFISDAKKEWYKNLLGSFAPTRHDMNVATIARLNHTATTFMHQELEEMPLEFDAREKWKNCESISEIQDQSRCGGCWAVASAAAMSDRACIHSNGERKPRLSAIDLLSCCSDCQGTPGDGCQGGYAYRAWIYYTNRGLVTGGPFGSTKSCKPYLFGASNSPMEEGEYRSPQCTTECKNKKEYYNDKHYGADVVYPNGMESIQEELFTNGPITAQIEVHEDLISYQSGVYVNQHGSLIGGHSVRIIGFGEEEGVPYWLIANSWGEEWGNNGTFKMIRGINHLTIEQFAVAGAYDYVRSAETTKEDNQPADDEQTKSNDDA